jgi:riboflavin biosynthesis pyrimidine reductase
MKEESRQYLNESAEYLSQSRTATQTRIKAQEVRQRADSLMNVANTMSSDNPLKQALISEAENLKETANRISATRGTTRKMKILANELIDDDSPQ